MVAEYAYFDFRGLSLPPRLMLAHVNEPVIVKRYPVSPQVKNGTTLRELRTIWREGEKGVIDAGEWPSVKNSLGLDVPTMPYLIDGSVRLTQAMAICAYLEAKHKLFSNAEPAVVGRAAMMTMIANDWLNAFRFQVTVPMPKELSDANGVTYRQDWLPQHMKWLDDMLAKKTSKYLVTDTPLTGDFYMFDYVELMMHFASDIVEQYPNVVKYVGLMEELEAVKKVRQEEPDAFWPASPCYAMWGL